MTDPDDKCMRCGYDLTGLDVKGVCPECSTPVFESLDSAPHRRLARTLVRWSLVLIVAAQLCVIAGVLGFRHTTWYFTFAMLGAFGVVSSWGVGVSVHCLAEDPTTRSGRKRLYLIGIAAAVLPVTILIASWFL